MGEYQTIKLEKKDGYAVVILNRPREMNALSSLMRQELDLGFASLEADGEVAAVLLTGGNYVFSAGMDIKEMAALGDEEVDDYFQSVSRFLKRIYTFPKPVVAAVGGIALGGGFNLAIVCDLIVASETAIFSHPELQFGLNPMFGPLKNLVGLAKAKEITMLGEPIGAGEALRIGLVVKLTPPEKLTEAAEKMVYELARRPPAALAAVKRISDLVPRLDKSHAVDLEFNFSAHLFSRPERKKHMAHFLEVLNQRRREKK